MEKGKKTKGRNKSKQHMTIMFIVLLMALSLLNQVLSGYQKDHAVSSPLNIHKDQCLCTIFPLKDYGWTQESWGVFSRDLTVKCT